MTERGSTTESHTPPSPRSSVTAAEAAEPAGPERVPENRAGIFTSLRVRDYRYYAGGQVVSLLPTGLVGLLSTTAADAGVQLSVPPEPRGRVMGLYMLVFLGGTPVGAPLLGWLGQVYGWRAPTLVGGAASVLVLVVGLRRALKDRPADLTVKQG